MTMQVETLQESYQNEDFWIMPFLLWFISSKTDMVFIQMGQYPQTLGNPKQMIK